MPITQSAKKAIRQSARKQVYNLRRKNKVDDAVRKLKKLVGAGKTAEARTSLSTVYKAIDKAAKGNTLNKGTADRMKSRLNAFVKRAVVKKA
jgi:small subunit ribosomal protein S20